MNFVNLCSEGVIAPTLLDGLAALLIFAILVRVHAVPRSGREMSVVAQPVRSEAPRTALRQALPPLLFAGAWIGLVGAALCLVGSRIGGRGLLDAEPSLALVPRHVAPAAAWSFAGLGYALPVALLASAARGQRGRLRCAQISSLAALVLGCRALAQGWSALQFFALIPVCLLALRAQARLREGEVASLSLQPRANGTR